LRTPFRTEIDGYHVAVSEAGSAVMMQDSAVMMIKDKFFGEKRKNDGTDTTTKKKQRTFNSGSAAVSTIFGACGYVALHHSSRRDLRQNKEARDNQIKAHRNEKKFIEKTLSMLEDRKKRCRLAKEKNRQSATRREQQQELIRQQQQQRQRQQQQQQQGTNVNDAQMFVSENSPGEIMRDPANVAADLSTTGGSTLCTMSQRTQGSHLVRGSGGRQTTNANLATGAATGPAVVAVGATSHLVGADTGVTSNFVRETGATSHLDSATGATSHLVGVGDGTPATVGTEATEATEATGATGAATTQADTSTEEYWEIKFESKADDKKLFLRLFEPTSGVLSKKKEEQWAVIQSKILPQLSQAAVVAKEATYRRRLSVLTSELKELTEMDSDNDSPGDVGENLAEA
jgi:hypothetical protein